MTRWAAFFIFVFITGQLIATSVEGGGFAATRLDGPLSEAATTVTVNSTTNFLSADASHPAYMMVGDEVVSYTDKTSTQFTPCVRGVADPQTGRRMAATAHSDNTVVRTLNIAAMDSFMGYNITTSGAGFGTLDAIKFAGRTFVNMPKFLTWDYPWFEGPWVVVRFILFAFSGGFIFGLAIAMMQLARGIWGV